MGWEHVYGDGDVWGGGQGEGRWEGEDEGGWVVQGEE